MVVYIRDTDIKHTSGFKLWAWPGAFHHLWEHSSWGKNRNWSINIRLNISTCTLMLPRKHPAWLQFQSCKIIHSFTVLSLVPTKPGDVVRNNSSWCVLGKLAECITTIFLPKSLTHARKRLDILTLSSQEGESIVQSHTVCPSLMLRGS